MLTEIDDRVRAAVTLHAVFGALPRLVELDPVSRDAVAGLDRPVSLTVTVPGLDPLQLVFDRDGARPGYDERAVRARLAFRSTRHLARVMAGAGTPIPIAGPTGLRFITRVFTVLSDRLAAHLQPGDAPTPDVDAGFAERSRLLTLEVAAGAIVVVGNEDRSGRYSAAQMSDGDLELTVGDLVRYRLRVRAHRLTRVEPGDAAPRAVFAFRDLDTVGDVLAGRESALACVGDGRIALRGYIPLLDNTSRILDRVGHYLGDSA